MGITHDRVYELLDRGMDPNQPFRLMKSYKDRYGVGTNAVQVKQYIAQYLKEKAVEVPEPPTEADEDVPVYDLTSPTIVQDFVSDKLLQNIANISQSVKDVGGPEKALALALTIETAGGYENFSRAVQLLQAIGASSLGSQLRSQLAPDLRSLTEPPK
jgi:hypothetical protein